MKYHLKRLIIVFLSDSFYTRLQSAKYSTRLEKYHNLIIPMKGNLTCQSYAAP